MCYMDYYLDFILTKQRKIRYIYLLTIDILHCDEK